MAFSSWIGGLLALQFVFPIASALLADGWRNRTIYQVLTDRFALRDNGEKVDKCDPTLGIYCGGSWRGIYDHLDYIQNMNFDAIWISPIVANMPDWTSDGQGYPGYWQQSLYEINLAFGSEEELNMLIEEVHKRGMLIMLDIVVNHMVLPGPPSDDMNYGIMHPFNDEKYYHPYCHNDYSDSDLENLQNCWLGGKGALLADLDTESTEVQEMLAQWIKNQIWKYNIDGLRIDAALNVQHEFFTGFMEKANTFATGEVYTHQIDLACKYSETIGSFLNYPLYFQLTYSLEGNQGDMNALSDTIKEISGCAQDVTVLGNFAENHDVVRFANNTDDMARAQNIVTFILTHDGIPIIYYGEEQHLNGGTEPYFNRAALWEYSYNQDAVLYKLIAKLNLFRRHMSRNWPGYLTTESSTIDVQQNSITFAKGGENGPKAITILNNKGADADDFKVELCDKGKHGYSGGDELFDVVACKSVSVQDNGCIEAWVADGEPVVLLKKSELAGSTLCGIEGKSDVDLVEQYVQRTTYTTDVSGQLTVMHSATTMPLSEAPASATSTSSTVGDGSGATATGASTGTSSATRSDFSFAFTFIAAAVSAFTIGTCLL